MSRSPNASFLSSRCPHCRIGNMQHTECFNEWWLQCVECEHLLFCYVPMEHQLAFHYDPAKFKMFAGGFGSAKTSTAGAEFVMLALGTPHGRGLVGAHTYPQLEMTAKKQVMEMLPKCLIESESKQHNIVTLTNGYEILFRSFDDEQKLRSLNLCHVLMEEANGTKFEVFTQLQTRLRHHATDNHKIIMSTNPDMNWVKTEVLLKASRIVGSQVEYHQDPDDINPNIAVHIAKTEYNHHLPENYIADVSAGKPDWWVRRYLEGSFENAEGRVYPNFESVILKETAGIDYNTIVHNVKFKGWRVMTGTDFGLRDDTTLLMGALDPDNGILYIYDEYSENQLSVATHAQNMKQRLEHVPLGSLVKMVADPSGSRRSMVDMKSMYNHFAEHGIHFQEGNNRIEAGIQKVFGYIDAKRVVVLPHLKKTINQHINYMYKEQKEGHKASEVPIDYNNHLVDTLRYMIGELPDDPNQLSNETFGIASDMMALRHGKKEEQHLPYELQDDSSDYTNYTDSWYNSF